MKMMDLNKIQELPPSGLNNDMAKTEESSWVDIDKALFHKRKENLENLIFCLAKLGLIIGFGFFIILSSIWIWHLVGPECGFWINSKNLQDLERLIFASFIINCCTKYISKYQILEEGLKGS